MVAVMDQPRIAQTAVASAVSGRAALDKSLDDRAYPSWY